MEYWAALRHENAGGGLPPSQRRKGNKIGMKQKVKKNIINIYYIPALALFGIFVIYPLLKGLQLSFTNWDGFSQNYSNVGWRNYQTLFKDANIKTTLINTGDGGIADYGLYVLFYPAV